jgi:hypothetical protein
MSVHMEQSGVAGPARIDFTGGRTLTVATFIPQQRRLLDMAEREVSQVQTEPVLASVMQEHTVSFGPFSLSLAGISSGGRTVAWTDIATVDLVGGLVRVGRPGTDVALPVVPASTVPNLATFLAVARDLAAAPSA